MSAGVARRRWVLARWASELTLGIRLSVAGGRSGRARLAMISVGVGLGVSMLLVAATIPALVAARDARIVARAEQHDQSVPRGADTLLIAVADSQYRDRTIHGRLLAPDGDRAPLPPGVTRRLAPGEMVASPALDRLLKSDDGAALRGRWHERVVGTIGSAGLTGPGEYAFYLGSDRLTEDSAFRIRSFGRADVIDQGLPPFLLLLGVVGLVVLLLPVLIFVATAVRFGGEARDRQLAALRLVGADAAMTRRIAAGETLAGALLGLLAGGLCYAAAGVVASRFVSFYLSDFRPVPALAALVVVAVPVGAVLVTLSALRRVVVEPLGVVRLSGDRRRRLWWRLVFPVAGLALLYPLFGGLSNREDSFNEYQVIAGVAALLVGVALLLPWLVAATVRRLGGGGVAWQLAVRRLQLDSGTAVRAVSGIAVSVAGAIALQGVLAAVQAQYTVDIGSRSDRFQAQIMTWDPAASWESTLTGTKGVTDVGSMAQFAATAGEAASAPGGTGEAGGSLDLMAGDCSVLRLVARIDACTDGDVFIIVDPSVAAPDSGSRYHVTGATGPRVEQGAEATAEWTLPATVRTVSPRTNGGPVMTAYNTILATPAALRDVRLVPASVRFYAALDESDPDAMERLRTAATKLDPLVMVNRIQRRTVEATLLTIRQGLLAGAGALLLLIGASLLVNVAEQLRERRRLLAVLMAFGTRRSTLTGSVLFQTAIPVLLGMILAVATGTGVAAILQTAVGAPVQLDWFGIGATSAAAALVVLLTTAAGLPLLWRLTKPGGLRSE